MTIPCFHASKNSLSSRVFHCWCMSSQVKCVVNAVVGVQPPSIWLEANSLKESGSCKFIRTEWTMTMKYNESHMNLPPWWNRWHVYTGDLLAYSIGTLNHCQKKDTAATAWRPQRPSGAWGQMRTSEPLQLAEDCSQVHSGSFVVLYVHWEMQVGYTTRLGCGWDLVCGGGMPKELIRFIVKMMHRLETCYFFLDDRD